MPPEAESEQFSAHCDREMICKSEMTRVESNYFFLDLGQQLYIKTIGPPTMAHGPGKQDFITVSYS